MTSTSPGQWSSSGSTSTSRWPTTNTGNRVITDPGRIEAALPTLDYLREQGARVLLVAHLGRPKGKVDPALSLAPVAQALSEYLGTVVDLAPTSTKRGNCSSA